MSGLVVDACVALKWFVRESDADRAQLLLQTHRVLYAPDSVVLEVANGIWKNVRLGRLPAEMAIDAIERLPRFFSDLVPFETIRSDALALALRIDHPVYDCAFVTTAVQLDARLITMDEKLVAKLKAAGIGDRATLLTDWTP
jgi:predicted nucleic acid-binding protein